MPNIAKVLKEEISRISRKEAKALVAPVRKPTVKMRKSVADLKRRMAALERAHKRLQVLMQKMAVAQPAASAPAQAPRARITAKGMRSLRRKIRFTRTEFATLIGVTDQAVGLWEKREGALRLRESTRSAILSVRGLGAREARQRLAESAPAKKVLRQRRKQR